MELLLYNGIMTRIGRRAAKMHHHRPMCVGRATVGTRLIASLPNVLMTVIRLAAQPASTIQCCDKRWVPLYGGSKDVYRMNVINVILIFNGNRDTTTVLSEMKMRTAISNGIYKTTQPNGNAPTITIKNPLNKFCVQ